MHAMANEELQQTFIHSPREATVEFTYKSGARPLEGYTIKRGLGVGGFGEVYYALSDGGKEVAIKLVQRHLDIELRGVSQCLNIKHPNLVSIFDVRSNERGESWIVMEYMAGASLADRLIEANGPLPFAEAMRWLTGIASAVDFLHQHGVVHRDLKPGNVFSEDEVVKIGDYGLSKFISASRRSGQTQSIGTVHYMAPEIATGNYGRSIDVYAAAVIAFEMLAGGVPFDGQTTGEILMKHLTAAPDFSNLPERFRAVFAKALAKVPDERHPSVGDLVASLKACEGVDRLTTVAPPKAETPTPRAARNIRPLAASLAPLPGTFASKRREFSDFLWSLFLAGLFSMILGVAGLAGEILISDGHPDLRDHVSLAVMSGLGSAAILTLARRWDRRLPDAGARRLQAAGAGALLGGAALFLNAYLDSDGLAPRLVEAVHVGLWNEQVFDATLRPAVEYMGFAAILLAIPNWSALACRIRPAPFSVKRVIWPASLGLCGSLVCGVDQAYWVAGLMTYIAIIVQWVSPRVDQSNSGVR